MIITSVGALFDDSNMPHEWLTGYLGLSGPLDNVLEPADISSTQLRGIKETSLKLPEEAEV